MTGEQREDSGQQDVPTLTDNAIVTERTGGRRAFLAQTGTILLGALAIVSSRPAYADSNDSDRSTPGDFKLGKDSDAKDPGRDNDRIQPGDAKDRDRTSVSDRDRSTPGDFKLGKDSDAKDPGRDNDRIQPGDPKS